MTGRDPLGSPSNSLIELVTNSPRNKHKLSWFGKRRLMGKRVFTEIYKNNAEEDPDKGGNRTNGRGDNSQVPQGKVCLMKDSPYRICKVSIGESPNFKMFIIKTFLLDFK